MEEKRRKGKVSFHTLGCKVNQYETEAMAEDFRKHGYSIVTEGETADIYIINTCTVTNLADRKSRQFIRRAKRENPGATIAVTGCYVQTSPEEVAGLEEVDLVCGNGLKQNMVDYVEEFLNQKKPREPDFLCSAESQTQVENCTQAHLMAYEELNQYPSCTTITSMESRTRAYIKIEEGCNRFCSYCIIPTARGQVRSRPMEEIIKEAEGLLAKGFKELILTGINTALYGQDLGMLGIAPLIEKLNDLDGDFRIRLSSLEPTVINADYVKKLFPYEKLCHHLHLSVQSGSDNILMGMNRRYDRAEYLDIVRLLQKFDPAYGISTDIIVGFPGESDEDFQDSIKIVEEVKFCKVHAFKYSPRKGTKASTMAGQIDGRVKEERSHLLMEAGESAARRFHEESRGTVRRVLFEEKSGDGLITGYTDNYIKVYAVGDESMFNEFYNVKLLKLYNDGMKGEIIHG